MKNQFDDALELISKGFPDTCRHEPGAIRIMADELERRLEQNGREGYIITMEQIAWRAKVWSTFEAKAQADEQVGG